MTKKKATGLPPQWEEVFAGRSMRDIATKAGMHADRVSRFVKGEGVADGTAEKIADALGITVKKALELRGEPVREPFVLPRKANQLSYSQREAILRVIDGMLEGRNTDTTEEPPHLRAVDTTPTADPADTLAAHKGRTMDSIEREQHDRWDGIDPPGSDEGA